MNDAELDEWLEQEAEAAREEARTNRRWSWAPLLIVLIILSLLVWVIGVAFGWWHFSSPKGVRVGTGLLIFSTLFVRVESFMKIPTGPL